jgi:hypothetical protein
MASPKKSKSTTRSRSRSTTRGKKSTPASASAAAGTKRLFPAADEIRVRLYGQGLGDCFLLAFPRPGQDKNPCYLVIDCGVAMSTPKKDDRM